MCAMNTGFKLYYISQSTFQSTNQASIIVCAMNTVFKLYYISQSTFQSTNQASRHNVRYDSLKPVFIAHIMTGGLIGALEC